MSQRYALQLTVEEWAALYEMAGHSPETDERDLETVVYRALGGFVERLESFELNRGSGVVAPSPMTTER